MKTRFLLMGNTVKMARGDIYDCSFTTSYICSNVFFFFSGPGEISLDERSSKWGWRAEREDHQTWRHHNTTSNRKRIPSSQRQSGCSNAATAATTATTATATSSGVSAKPACTAACPTAIHLNLSTYLLRDWQRIKSQNKMAPISFSCSKGKRKTFLTLWRLLKVVTIAGIKTERFKKNW